jgi:hypothetical protein
MGLLVSPRELAQFAHVEKDEAECAKDEGYADAKTYAESDDG